MKTFKNIVTLFIGFLFIQFAIASDLISAKELSKISKEKNVIVISAQKTAAYQDFHITGSINLPPKDLTTDEPTPYTCKTPAQMAAIIGKKGVSENNTIIIYDEGSSKYSGRLYWVFKYLGAKDVKILDGGIKSWQAIRKPVTKTTTKLAATTFNLDVQKQLLASLETVKTATTSKSYAIIDARSDSEYEGTNETQLRKGHIPNAIHVEYTSIINSDGTLKTAEEMKAIYVAKGVTPDKTVIIYCKSSVRAAIEYMALSSILNYPNVMVYDGAFYEWEYEDNTDVVGS